MTDESKEAIEHFMKVVRVTIEVETQHLAPRSITLNAAAVAARDLHTQLHKDPEFSIPDEEIKLEDIDLEYLAREIMRI